MTVIDISTYQGVVDFAALKAAGVSRVIAKMGGGDAGVYVDSRWVANLAGIRANGLALGTYFFNGPGDTPTQAADFQFQNIDWQPGDWAVIDVEGHGIAYSPAQAFEWAQRMLSHGVPASDVLIYMSRSVENTEDFSAIASLHVQPWIADYGANTGQPGTPPHTVNWPSWALWQYTSNGTIPGITGRVDLSLESPAWASTTITNLEDTMPAYTLLAATDAPLQNTWVYIGLPASFVLSGDPGDNLAEKESICVWNGVKDVPTLEAGVVRCSSVAVQNAINHIPTSGAVTISDAQVASLAAQVKMPDLASLVAQIAALSQEELADTANIEAILTKGLSISGSAVPSK